MQIFLQIFRCQLFCIDPADVDTVRGLRCRRALRLPLRSNKHHAELTYLPTSAMVDSTGGMLQILQHLFPVFQIRLRAGQIQTFTDRLSQMLFFHHYRHFIKGRCIQILQNMFLCHVTEQSRSFLSFFHQSDNPNGKPGYPARSPYSAAA